MIEKLKGYSVKFTKLLNHEGVSFKYWKKNPGEWITVNTSANPIYDKYIVVAQKTDDSKVRRVLSLQVKGTPDINNPGEFVIESYSIETFDQSWIPDRTDLPNPPSISRSMKVPDYNGTSYIYPKSNLPNQIDGDSSIRIKMSGKYGKDWEEFFRRNGFVEENGYTKQQLIQMKAAIQKEYTLHHMNDFDPETLSCTVQLVQKGAHDRDSVMGIAHEGAVSDYRKYTGKGYK